MAYSDDTQTFTATITAGGSLSAAVPIGGLTLVGMTLGATFDATTTNVQFLVSRDDSTYNILKDNDGNPVVVTVAASNTNKATHLDPPKFAPWNSVKIGTYKVDGTSVQTQTAETAFELIAAKVTG